MPNAGPNREDMRKKAMFLFQDRGELPAVHELAGWVLSLLRQCDDGIRLSGKRGDALITISNGGCKHCKPLADVGLRAAR